MCEGTQCSRNLSLRMFLVKFMGVREIGYGLCGRFLTQSEVIGHKVDNGPSIPAPYLSHYIQGLHGCHYIQGLHPLWDSLEIAAFFPGNSLSGEGPHDTRS